LDQSGDPDPDEEGPELAASNPIEGLKKLNLDGEASDYPQKSHIQVHKQDDRPLTFETRDPCSRVLLRGTRLFNDGFAAQSRLFMGDACCSNALAISGKEMALCGIC
jgi:hypothetical protein